MKSYARETREKGSVAVKSYGSFVAILFKIVLDCLNLNF